MLPAVKYVQEDFPWVRPSEIHADTKFVNKEGYHLSVLDFTHFSNPNFVGALGLLARHPPALQKIFLDVENLEKGYAAFQLFKDGEWRAVVVDTLLCYRQRDRKHLFCHSMEMKEVWVELLQKAYAKLHGSYEKIKELSISQILTELTGGSVEIIDFEERKLTGPALFKLVEDTLHNPANQKKVILGCFNKVEGKNPIMKETVESGMLQNHHYGILLAKAYKGRVPPSGQDLQLLKISNFWGICGGWSGNWCNYGEHWDRNKDISEELWPHGQDPHGGQSVFFLDSSDLRKYFTELVICRLG